METDIAVVGHGSFFPDAKNSTEFWQNILSKRVSIRPLPQRIFESDIFYRPELLTAFNKNDKSITHLAGWIDDLSFDTSRKYKIPPSVTEHMDLNQHAALYTAAQALEMNALEAVAKDRVAVIFGNGMVGMRYGDAMFRVQFQMMEHYLRQHPTFQGLSAAEQRDLIDFVRDNVLKDTLPISEDSAPGILPNIIAGRIANVYDFHGPSFTVDAACASVLAAVITAIQGLQLREYDAAVCGGSDMPLKQLGFVLFSALNALSPDGSYPFDARANGFVMSQGAGAVLLKRLDDAVRHKDTIYAVITGYGQTSDGKGKYIAAPNAEWQAQAIEKACRMAGCPVDTIEMVEAHGTATKVGDVVEVDGLKQAFKRLGAARQNYCGLTSVKSNIGHLKSAAGIAGLLKTILAIHHKTLPPTANFTTVNPKLALDGSPFYILDECREWPENLAYPRRANVSSFGFGGADYHLSLQEYRPQDYKQQVFRAATLKDGVTQDQPGEATHAGRQPALPAQDLHAPGVDDLHELLFFSADSLDGLDQELVAFQAGLAAHSDLPFAEYCALHNYTTRPGQRCRLALLVSSPADLAAKYQLFRQQPAGPVSPLLRSRGIYYKAGDPVTPEQTAVLFPGQASQYPGMFAGVYEAVDSVRACFRKGDAYWLAHRGHTISSLLFPTAMDDETALERLRGTHNAHPAIFLSSYALYDLLARHGLAAGWMAGHSLGEITALAAAGMVSFEQALALVERRGYAFADAQLADPGAMLSLAGSLEDTRQLLSQSGAGVVIANTNSPRQVVLAGPAGEVDQLKEFLDGKKVNSKRLYVSHAFHSPLMAPVAERFYHSIQDFVFTPSPVRVVMNHTGQFYPDEREAMAAIPGLLRDQIVQPVDFVGGIRKLYAGGVRLFIEVGPGSILSSLVKDILDGQEASILTSNTKGADDLTSLQKLSAALFTEGVRLDLALRSRPARPAPPPLVISSQPQPSATGSAPRNERLSLVYSGTAVGLPGSYKNAFQDDNFEQLFAGRNLIERLTDEEKQKLVDLQITKLIKEESGPVFKLLTSLEDVIQLAGKIGRIDMIRDYHLDEKLVNNMTACIAHGVAAGYEALKDAHIPLVREYVQTSTGKALPQKLALPREMQEETGVIFANGFPQMDHVIAEVSRMVSYTYGSKARKELLAFYEGIIGRVKDETARKLLTDWFALYYNRFSPNPGEEEVYRFNHLFMTAVSSQANNLLAYLLNARGPNLQMNAACSSTGNAITIAEDFIRTGRVKRMIVIGADDPTSKTSFPLLGAAFLCSGAATSEGDLYKAAIPFDVRRNGMLVGAGSVGIVLETRAELERRGVAEICELLGSHSFNTAKHISQIDAESFAQQLEKFICQMEAEYGLRREALADDLVYISHETFTPPRGGCSQTEAEALHRVFGSRFSRIIVGNTKGMTGHLMGAALEDAVAAKSLQYGKCPPVVHFAEPDPMLAGLNLWQGGRHNRSFALKMSAGFGMQGNFVLLRKGCSGDERIRDRQRHADWLNSISGDGQAAVELWGRVLRVKEQAPESTSAARLTPRTAAPVVKQAAPVQPAQPHAPTGMPAGDSREQAGKITALLAQASSYPPEMLEPEMEFEADLGIGGEKLAAILNGLEEQLDLPPGSLQVGADATVGQLLARAVQVPQKPGLALPTPASPPAAAAGSASALAGPTTAREAIVAETLKLFSEITKYPVEMLELDMAMEADLGIDTVKQATILGILGEKYGLERQEGLQLSQYPTIRHIVDLVYSLGTVAEPPPLEPAPAKPQVNARGLDVPGTEPAAPLLEPAAPGKVPAGKEAVIAETLQLFSEITKYPVEMLELDMAMEADLGIDTVKQATILGILSEKYGLQRQEGLQLSQYPTIRHIVDLIYSLGTVAEPPVERTPPAAGSLQSQETAQPAVPPLPVRSWENDLSRQTPVLAVEVLGVPDLELAGKLAWVVGDDRAVVVRLAATLEDRGAAVAMFIFPQVSSIPEIEQAVSAFVDQRAGQPAHLIVDSSHPRAARSFYDLGSSEASQLLLLNSTARYILYKAISQASWRPERIVCVTAMDGRFGLDPDGPCLDDPTYQALAGLYKALRKEWPGSDVRIVDLPPEVLGPGGDGFEWIITECQHASSAVEVGYANGARLAVKLVDKAIRLAEQLTYTDHDTFLVTGGGSGVTAHVLLALAQHTPANFIVVDLIPLPENIDELARLDEAGLEKVRHVLHETLRQENPKVTPALLTKEFGRLTRAIEIHHTLSRVRQLGRKVVYVACDVRDRPALLAGLDRARQVTGPITAIVHAAGIDASHRIEQKSMAEFQDVFTVKALGAWNVMDATRADPLRLVVAFSSIAGRFGSAAQLDYSAANSFLDGWIKMLRRERPGLHTLSLAWSSWKDAGIAWRNEFVRHKSEEMGINFIEIEQGVAAFMQEISSRSAEAEVILHRGLDGFLERGMAEPHLPDYPLIDRLVEKEGQPRQAYRLFNVQRDAFIDQHRLGQVPIMPAVGYAELAVEYFALQAGRQEHYRLENMTFNNAFKLFHEGRRELFVEGEPVADGCAWDVRIQSRFKPPRSEETQVVLHSQARVSGGPLDLDGLDPVEWSYHHAEPSSLPADQSLLLIQGEGPQQRIVLGSLYNDVLRQSQGKEPVLIYPQGTRYPAYFPLEQLTCPKYPLDKLLVNPCFLDSLYQACAAHLLVNKKRVYLPWEIGELGIVREPGHAGQYTCHTQVVEETGEVVAFNVVMLDGDGNVCYYARRARFRRINL